MRIAARIDQLCGEASAPTAELRLRAAYVTRQFRSHVEGLPLAGPRPTFIQVLVAAKIPRYGDDGTVFISIK